MEEVERQRGQRARPVEVLADVRGLGPEPAEPLRSGDPMEPVGTAAADPVELAVGIGQKPDPSFCIHRQHRLEKRAHVTADAAPVVRLEPVLEPADVHPHARQRRHGAPPAARSIARP